MMIFWIGFGLLTGLTLVWAVLIRLDARAYIDSQIKVLGEENRRRVDTKQAKVFFTFYLMMLLLILVGFALSFIVLL